MAIAKQASAASSKLVKLTPQERRRLRQDLAALIERAEKLVAGLGEILPEAKASLAQITKEKSKGGAS